MSMAHGLECRVPLLDHPLVEFAASIPADLKFEGGTKKQSIKSVFADVLPKPLIERRDKMGFPFPLSECYSSELKNFIGHIFTSQSAARVPSYGATTCCRTLPRSAVLA